MERLNDRFRRKTHPLKGAKGAAPALEVEIRGEPEALVVRREPDSRKVQKKDAPFESAKDAAPALGV
jgi:hypothetical protein